MMILTLPLEEKCPDNWQAFRLGLRSVGLSLTKIPSDGNGRIKAQINVQSEQQEQAVLDFVQLCFMKCYSV